ncbi:MAG: hypothetical protein QOG98_3259 [Pseudonocardiales bacterium]|nr:hypothetical protein [Pseudonocardiales bacterium]
MLPERRATRRATRDRHRGAGRVPAPGPATHTSASLAPKRPFWFGLRVEDVAASSCWNGRWSSPDASHGVDCLSQCVQRVVGAGLDGARWHAQGFGGLGHRCVAEVALEQHLAMLGRQRP